MSRSVVFTLGEAVKPIRRKSKAWFCLYAISFTLGIDYSYPCYSRLERAFAGLPLLRLLPVVLLFHDTLCTFACPDWRRMGRNGTS